LNSQSVCQPIFRISGFYAPRKVTFGLNALDRVGSEAKFAGGKDRALVMSDPSLRAMGVVNKVEERLKKEGFEVEVYDKVEPEPRIEVVEEVAESARKERFDVVIGVGGGSVMDTAKVASMSISNPGSVETYFGVNLVKERGAPLICLPTTAGTGSEVTMYAVITVGDEKRAITSPYIIPDVAVVDPMLTMTMPSNLTAGSGMDALSHAIESMISIEATPLTDAIALEAVKLIFNHLRTAYHKGTDLEARYYMSLAANMAGFSLCNAKMVLGHSISQTFGPSYRVPHGISNGITLPYIMKFYVPAAADKLALIVKATGEDVEGLSTRQAATKAVKAVKILADDLGIPSSLKDVGVPKNRVPALAEICFNLWPRPNSPIKLTKEAVLKVFEEMWEGRL